MNVLSLFDGMSCGQVALNRLGIKYDKYFSSEIDKYAIAVTQYNYPDTIQIGDIIKVKANDLPKIDLLIGGSPCQGFSFAGKRLNFEDQRSKLFFEFVRLLKECKPKYFLLENVKMKKEYQDIITRYLDVEPILINSNLVSAQNRKRLYWTNIKNIEQPKDKNIMLKDIIEYESVDINKSYCIDANYYKGGSLKQYLKKKRRQIVYLPSDFHQSEKRLMVKTIPHGFIKEEVKQRNKYPSLVGQDPSSKYAICIQDKSVLNFFNKNFGSKPGIQVNSKCSTLQAAAGMGGGNVPIIEDTGLFRKLLPLECERLQTLSDNYTKLGNFSSIIKEVSNSQRYKMIGNGWTVDVICHIFSYMEV